ncbi:MAG: hypothetical protein EHM41_00200 [Chloroflexi bacterium]|nr:MAG: hypothetical protein EHM41_00200 [Chloroflexota bacterium]
MATARTRLIDVGFERMEGTPITGLFVTTMGHTDMGKTTFGLTAPGPMLIFDGDKGLKGVVEKFIAEGKEIHRYSINMPELPETKTIVVDDKKTKNLIAIDQESLKAAQDEWTKLQKATDAGLEDSSIRTLFYDTGSILWELFRLSKFGKTLQVPASAYSAINPEFTQFLNKLKKATEEKRKNIIISHKMRSVYIEDKKTSRYEMAGFGGLDYISDIIGEMRCDKETHEYGLFLHKCKPNGSLRWELFTGDMCTFPMIATMATGQDITEWM